LPVGDAKRKERIVMVKLAAVCMALFSCLAFAPMSASAAPASVPPWYTVRLITANGSGCPPGTVSVSQLNNHQFTVIYNSYIADAGNGASPGDFRKNCVLAIRIGVPSGWTFGIAQATYRGYAHLDSGATGTVEADYWLTGSSWTVPSTRPMSGPRDSTYTFTDRGPVGTFAVCHTSTELNVDTSVRVFAGSTPSFYNELTMDSSDFGTHTIFNLSFAPC
jgi:hypothetical protein